MSTSSRAFLACAASLALAASPSLGAQSRPRIVLAVDGVAEPRNLPVLLAERLGYFAAEGVTVTLVDAPASPSPAELMADGRADGAVAYYHHTFMSQIAKGPVATSVAVLAITPDERLLVASRLRARVRQISDLKGMKIITGGPNSGKTTATTWALLHAGLTAEDYQRLPLSSRDAMARELADGKADAIMAHEPDASFYVASGAAFELADLITPAGTRSTLGTYYPSTALYFAQGYIAGHPCAVKRVSKAVLDALRFIETHDAGTIVSALPPKMVGPDRAAFTRRIAADKQMFGGTGKMDRAAAQAELRAMSAIDPAYRKVRIGLTYTNAFIDGSSVRSLRCR